jgi:hypothetical protein
MALSNPSSGATPSNQAPSNQALGSQVPAVLSVEDQLAQIIASARNVAVIAEELLRDVSQAGAEPQSARHAISMAPRLLAATEQQLVSVAAILRQS